MATKKELVPKDPAGVPETYDYGDQAGMGYEHQTAADSTIPWLAILQKGSPQVDDQDRFPDARAGQLFNTVTEELTDGRTGLTIVPCTTRNFYVEWTPRDQGGGFVGLHDINSAVVLRAVEEQGQFGRISLPNGNDLVQTFYIYGLQVSDDLMETSPIILSFKSTGIKPYRNLMGRLESYVYRMPLFGHRIRTLVDGGDTFAAAVTQAEGELRTELDISTPGFDPGSEASSGRSHER